MAGKHTEVTEVKRAWEMLVISVSGIPFPALCIQSKFWLEWKAWPLKGLSGTSCPATAELPSFVFTVSLTYSHICWAHWIQCSGHQECYVQMGQQRMQTYFTTKASTKQVLKIQESNSSNATVFRALWRQAFARHRSQAREVSLGSQQWRKVLAKRGEAAKGTHCSERQVSLQSNSY